jgi:hypothetical protein
MVFLLREARAEGLCLPLMPRLDLHPEG